MASPLILSAKPNSPTASAAAFLGAQALDIELMSRSGGTADGSHERLPFGAMWGDSFSHCLCLIISHKMRQLMQQKWLHLVRVSRQKNRIELKHLIAQTRSP
jgi:hypothetical protein